MVLTEAFAHGTPVVASDIAGYRDVVRDGVDGVLVPRGDATATASALRDLALDAPRREQDGRRRARARRPLRLAAGRRGGRRRVRGRPRDARARDRGRARRRPPRPQAGRRRAVRRGRSGRRASSPRLPRRWTPLAVARRAALLLVALAALAGAVVALDRIGVDAIAASLLTATPTWVLAALGVMATSMVLRALAWHAILAAALPHGRVRRTRRLPGHDDRRAHVGDAAGPPRRAVARAHRRPPARARRASCSRRARHDGLADAPEPPRAGAARRDDALDRRPLHEQPRARRRDDRAAGRAALRPRRAGAPARRRGGGRAPAARPGPRRPAGVPAARGSARRRRRCSSARGCCRRSRAGCCSSRSAWTSGRASARPRRCSSPSTSPRSSRRCRRTSACSRRRASSSWAPTGSAYADALAYGIILQAVEIATAVVMGAPALREGGRDLAGGPAACAAMRHRSHSPQFQEIDARVAGNAPCRDGL